MPDWSWMPSNVYIYVCFQNYSVEYMQNCIMNYWIFLYISLLWNSPILRTRISWVIKTKGYSCRPCSHWVSRHACVSSHFTNMHKASGFHFPIISIYCLYFLCPCLFYPSIYRQMDRVYSLYLPQFFFVLWAKNTIPKRFLGKAEVGFLWHLEST